MKKIIRSSHLALRFYRSDGWTRKEVEDLVDEGEIEDTFELHADADPYFRLKLHGKFKIDKIILCSHIINRYYQGEPKESDIDYLKSMQ